LATQKNVRDAEKRQKQELEEQDTLTSDISGALNSFGQTPTDQTGLQSQTERRIIDLRERAEHEKHADKARVLRRAVANVFAQALEAGLDRLGSKDADAARSYFQLALAAQPDSLWALRSLATACAIAGDRKGALEALRRAKADDPDKEAFLYWLRMQEAFTSIRSDPKFRALNDR
jgi:predicted Zn-dependent protease